MKYSTTILILFALLLLGWLSFYVLSKDRDSNLQKSELPSDTKEFVWVRADSLSKGLNDLTGGNIKIDTTSSRSYTISYTSKQYLLHEKVDGIKAIREHLVASSKDYMDYEETANLVEIKLKRKDNYVFCPAVILGRVLQWRSKNQQN